MPDEKRYFAQQDAPTDEGGSFVKWDEKTPIEILSGLNFQPVLGERMMVNFVTFEPNTIAPVHWHDEEQISIVIDGEFEFEVGGDKRIVQRGEAIHIPPNVPHGARTYDTTCLELDVFSPPRQGLLDLLSENGAA